MRIWLFEDEELSIFGESLEKRASTELTNWRAEESQREKGEMEIF